MNISLRLLHSLVLLQSILLFVGMDKVYGQSIDFEPPEISIYEGSGLSLLPFKVASATALDSLSRRYGIPLELSKRDSKHYSFALTSQITPNLTGIMNLRMNSKFTYKNTIILSDAANKREVIRVENYPKNLLGLSQNPDSLKRYYIKLYNHSFNLMAGYGLKKTLRSPAKNIAYIIFDDAVPSADLSRIKDVVKDVFVKNQEVMNYKVAFVPPKESPLTVYKIKVRIADSKENNSMKVALLFPAGVDLDYHSNPIQTEFLVDASDLKNRYFSYLLAKMTATLYKFSETNFK